MLFLKYLTFSFAICAISWSVGIIGNLLLRRTTFYKRHLSHLNFLPSARLNQMIGIDLCRWVIKNTVFRFLNPKIKVVKRPDLAQLIDLRDEMTGAEVSHLVAFLFVVVFAVIKSIQYDLLFGLMIMLVNVPTNLYPSLLQQENKRRMEPLIQRLQARAQG